MRPVGAGPNTIAWAAGRIRVGRMVRAGLILDPIGIGLIVGVVFGMRVLT